MIRKGLLIEVKDSVHEILYIIVRRVYDGSSTRGAIARSRESKMTIRPE
jgi:hypothetical protein